MPVFDVQGRAIFRVEANSFEEAEEQINNHQGRDFFWARDDDQWAFNLMKFDHELTIKRLEGRLLV